MSITQDRLPSTRGSFAPVADVARPQHRLWRDRHRHLANGCRSQRPHVADEVRTSIGT